MGRSDPDNLHFFVPFLLLLSGPQASFARLAKVALLVFAMGFVDISGSSHRDLSPFVSRLLDGSNSPIGIGGVWWRYLSNT